MCNPEFMALNALYTIKMQDDLLADQRDADRAVAEREESLEGMRQSEEQLKITQWADSENMKVEAAAGQAAVVMAGAGVDIDAITQTHTAKLSEVKGAESAQRRRVAVFGDIREANIEETLLASLESHKALSGSDKAMMLLSSVVQGIQMQKEAGTFDGKVFGIELPEWVTEGVDFSDLLTSSDGFKSYDYGTGHTRRTLS